MKAIIVTLCTLLSFSSFGESNESNYNLIPNTVDHLASGAKVDLILDAAVLHGQIFRTEVARGSVDSPEICFQVGRLFNSVIDSAARYGSRSKDETEQNLAKNTFLAGMNIASVCQKDPKMIM